MVRNDISCQNMVIEQGWQKIPNIIITREGNSLDTSSDIWHLPYVLNKNSSLDFSKITIDKLRLALKYYVKDRIERISTHAGYAVFHDVWREWFVHQKQISYLVQHNIEEQLILLIEESIVQARKNHRLWALYRPIQWYIYCAEHYTELGFNSAYALELEAMTIPSNPKGEAVRMEDLEMGALHRTLELPLLIRALKEDKSKQFEHVQQKVAIALSIAFGRNPANLTYLREEDFINLTVNDREPCFILKIPRIKKRQLNPRDDFVEEYLEPAYANYIMELIDINQTLDVQINYNDRIVPSPRPLFINKKGNRSALLAKDFDNVYNMCSADISNLLKQFVIRHKIISPITKKPLQINTRRLRYTLAVGLASEGISKRELARILDHSDTQHVLVYFEMANKIIEHLDKASAKGFSRYLKLFKGHIIDHEKEAINGNRDDKYIVYIDEALPKEQKNIGICGDINLCHLDPPFSCYLCPKFQPYKNADHEYVLDCLLNSRQEKLKKYENARLGVQLDEVIIAVTQVVELCQGAV